MNYDKKRWVVFFFSCLANLCGGSVYSWSAFSGAVADQIGNAQGILFTNSDIAIVFSLSTIVAPFCMVLGGAINEKLGPKAVLLISATLIGAGYALTGFATSLPMALIGFGIFVGFGSGMVNGLTIGNTIQFFPDMKGLISGTVAAVFGASSVIMPPIFSSMISAFGLSQGILFISIAFAALLALSAFFVSKPPVGYLPASMQAQRPDANVVVEPVGLAPQEMLKTPHYWLIVLLVMAGAFSGLMVSSQAAPMGMHMIGLSLQASVLVVSLSALCNGVGRIIGGLMSDRIGPLKTLLTMSSLTIIGLVFLSFLANGQPLFFYSGVILIAFCLGGNLGVFPSLVVNTFGPKHNTVNYGFVFVGFALGGLFGPLVMGQIVKATGTYFAAFLVAGAVCVLGLITNFIFKKFYEKGELY